MTATTLDGVLLKGVAASRPAANAVAKGTLYSATDTGAVTQSDGVSTWSTFATITSGFSNPMTTKGDLIVGDTGGSPIRKAVGSNAQVLTADSTATGGVKWAAAGGGGVTVQYPPLKPATPTDDFAAASLAGAWSAHSSGGSFATTDCLTQGDDWVGSSLRMMYSAQMGALYRTHANGDLDVTLGGVRVRGYTSAGMMVGIAALNSSGTGLGVIAYNDGTVYFVSITAWQEGSALDSWANFGLPNTTSGVTAGDYWFRLKRVSGTWTAYASRSGKAWDKTFSTSSTSITVDRIAIGLFFDTGLTYNATLSADYYQEDV